MPFTKGHTLWKHPNCKKNQFGNGQKGHNVPHTEETKLKMSQSRRGKCLGEDNPSWKGGTTPLINKIKRLPEYKRWQQGVYNRDNWTCRKCFKRGGQLTPHHLTALSYLVRKLKVKDCEHAIKCSELWDVKNGVTLCDRCHRKTSNFSTKAVKNPIDTTIYKMILVLLVFFVPVFSHAATFGYTSIGATVNSTGGTGASGPETAAEDGTITSMSIYGRSYSGTPSLSQGIYTDNAGDPDALIQSATDGTVSSTNAWNTTNISASISAGTDYWLAFGASVILYYSDSVSGYSRRNGSAGFPDPWSEISGTASRRVSIYATYTATPEEATTTTPRITLEGDVGLTGDVIIQ